MYNQNFRNQAVKEIKNGSSIASVARKFGMAIGTLHTWIKDYDEKMSRIMREEGEEAAPVVRPIAAGIELQSIKVSISGTIVTLRRNDVLKMLNLFNIFDEHIEGE